MKNGMEKVSELFTQIEIYSVVFLCRHFYPVSRIENLGWGREDDFPDAVSLDP